MNITMMIMNEIIGLYIIMFALLNSALIYSAHFNICGWMKEAGCG